MRTDGVPFRRVALGLGLIALAVSGILVALRSDGFQATEATVPRATRWFVNALTDQVVLADGFSGRPLARLATGAGTSRVEVYQSAGGAYVVDRTLGRARALDSAALVLGPPINVTLVERASTRIGIGTAGIVAVDPLGSQGVLIPPDADPLPFELGPDVISAATRVAPDAAVWTISDGAFVRVTTTSERRVYANGIDSGRVTLVGNTGMLLDEGAGRLRLGAGAWVDLPDGVVPGQVVLQEPGPTAACGWIAFGDQLRCISERGIVESRTIPTLAVGGGEQLAIAGDVAVLVDQANSEIVQFDWRAGSVIGRLPIQAGIGARLEVSVSIDLVWVDWTDGRFVWSIHPWGFHTIDKNAASAPLLGEDGQQLEAGQSGQDGAGAPGEGVDAGDALPEPDDNGVDDPPVANDDAVSARTGVAVVIPVTANDYDPDGEAVAVLSTGAPAHGTVEIGSASNVVYQPTPGYVGSDEFEYTITDAGGHTDSAMVRVTLLAADATNQAPVGKPDWAETGLDREVVVDVLGNDVDPERDALRIGSVGTPNTGTVTETVGPTGLPALRFEPEPGVSGTATFTYRPTDAFGAEGEPVAVVVEIAPPDQVNRPPITQPDSIRIRRDVPVRIPVLANDIDPDGDRLLPPVLVEPVPDGVEASVVGDQVVLVARAGASPLVRIGYQVSDAHGLTTAGSILVLVVGADERNRPPVANADTATAVVGEPVTIDVLRNDSDPDGDPLVLVGVEPVPGAPTLGTARLQDRTVQFVASQATGDDGSTVANFLYTIHDGHGNEATGTLAVKVLAEALATPPFAVNDAATTYVDEPVTINVLANDGDPSGERPRLVGTPSCAAGGSAKVTPESQVTFTPPAGRDGGFRCTYEVTNSRNLTATATIDITVLKPAVANLPPIVTDENVVVETGKSIDIDLLAGDTDPEGGVLRIVSSSQPTFGTATRAGSIVTYTAPSAPNTTVITYQVADPLGGISDGRAVIRIVLPQPVPPIANPDERDFVGPAVGSYEVNVLINDSDPDGMAGSIRLVNAALTSTGGAVTTVGDNVRFLPPAGFVGTMTATYRIRDADNLAADSTVTVNITEPPNRAPIAIDDPAEVVNGGSISVPIGLNDSDPDGDELTYSIVSGPDSSLGTATLNGATLNFTARPGATGTATIRYRLSDGELFAEADVRIAVQPCGVAAPAAPDVFLRTGYMTPIAIDLGQYASNGSIVDVGPPLSAPSGTYTPPAGQNGNVVFNYAVRNSCGIRATGSVTIDVNQEPVAQPLSLSMSRTATQSLAVTQIASDHEALTISGLVDAPSWVTRTADKLTLAPAGAPAGVVSFTVVVADPGGLTVDVPVTVTLQNGTPLAPDVQILVPWLGSHSVTIAATDPDGDSLQLRLGTVPEGYTATVDGLTVTVTASLLAATNNPATLEYTAIDPGGASDSGVITITLGAEPTPTPAPTTTTTVPPTTTTTVPPTTTTTEPPATTTTTTTGPPPTSTTLPCPYPPDYPPPGGGEWPPEPPPGWPFGPGCGGAGDPGD